MLRKLNLNWPRCTSTFAAGMLRCDRKRFHLGRHHVASRKSILIHWK